MTYRKVRVGAKYRYEPVMLDVCSPPIAVGLGKLKAGDVVRVVNLQGCPKANTMGHCHFELLGEYSGFGGLCCTNSLQPLVGGKA